MSQPSRLAGLRKHRERTLTQAQRRRRLVVGFEPLEDRRLLAVDTDFTAGVLTFTGDIGGVSNDKVVIESTATPGTINYDYGSGLGATTIAGVNAVLFNAGGGSNEMIVINQGTTVFRTFNGAPTFLIDFNVSDDPDFDVLRIVGGDPTTITSGTYSVLSPTSGAIDYTTLVPSVVRVSFSGLNSSGPGLDRVDDTTLQGGAFTTNSSTGAENVKVEVGPNLPPVQTFMQGPVFIDGGDRDDHGFHEGPLPGGANNDGWLFIQQALNFVHTRKVAEFGNATFDILAIGVHAGDALNALTNAAGELGLNITHANTVALINGAAFNSATYDLIYVPSNDNKTTGGITDAEEAALTARKADIQAYIRSGGGLVALTNATITGTSLPGYPWLELPLIFTIDAIGTGGISDPLRKTAEAIAAGFTISDTDLSDGVPYHNVFVGPPGFNGLDVFVKDDGPNNIVGDFDDRNVTLGQGATNQTVGGGLTTTISGNQMTLINIGDRSTLFLNARGGTDAITVDGTVKTLDGLISPLSINGGGQGDSLLIDDSADLTGDAVSVSSIVTIGLSPDAIIYGGIGPLSVRATQGPDVMTLNFSGAGPSSATIFGGLSEDLFTGPTGYMQPTAAIPISVHGGVLEAPVAPFNPFGEIVDKFNLDMTNRADGSPVLPVVIVDTNGGNAFSANTKLVRFTGIEDIDLKDDGLLTNTVIGDFYVRATGNADYIEFRSAAQVDPVFRVRVGNIYYPSSTGNFGPYTTGTSKVYVYGREGNDTITMYNTRLNGVIFGEEGNDVLTGGYGNDLLIGGQGDDRLNGAAVGGNDEVWGDDFDPVIDDPAVASQTGTGNDQINTFGGNDTVYGQGGNDIINTGAGDDYINGGPGGDQIDGQSGNDRIYAGSGVDVASGSDGNDIVAGNDGNDALYGRTGNDIVIGGLGQDIVNGNEGSDVLVGDDSSYAGQNSNSLAKGDLADAALLALMALWGPTPVLGDLVGFGSAGDDSSVDTLWGGAAADAFFGAPPDNAADRNAPGYGPDLN